MPKISVSIVLYEPDLPLLRGVVEALFSASLQLPIIEKWTTSVDLVNNKPNETHFEEIAQIALTATTELFKVELIDSGINGGYGAGNNISIRRHLDSDFHLVLNPDVLVSPDALTSAIRYMIAHPDVGLLTPLVRGFDNSIQYLCKQSPTLLDMFIRSVSSNLLNRIFSQRNMRYEMRNHDYNEVICPVPYPTGCFMFFRRAVLDIVGGFDEGYFLHFEDADIGRQVSIISLTAYVPSVVVLHKWSRDSHNSWRMRWVTIKSGFRYWSKWGGIW